MLSHQCEIRVSYSETDNMGYVHHSNYPKYCEIARWELFRSLGISYKMIEELGYILPVFNMDFQYIKPAYYDDTLRIKTELININGAKLRFCFHIFNQNDELINIGNITLAHVDKLKKKPCRISDFVYGILKANGL